MTDRLTTGNIAEFLIGREAAIRKVASSSAAIWTGVALTLLTAFARNYDQTYIAENPFLWFFGPLLFSLISGTWLYFIGYTICARRHFPADQPDSDNSWRGFMGAFWMTAPIAWLYAIPVERLYDSLTAAKTNIALLVVVSLWRVILMARVLQVVTKAPFFRTLCWVTIAASIEVLGLFFTSGAIMKRVMSAMSGLRNSPEEELLIRSFSFAGELAIWGFGVAVLTLLIWRFRGIAENWPKLEHNAISVTPIGIMAIVWVSIAVPNQIQLKANYELENRISSGDWRAALDLMGETGRENFARARPLPPKLYEPTIFREAFGLAGSLRTDDPSWVREHVAVGLRTVSESLREVWHPGMEEGNLTPEDLGSAIAAFGILPRSVLPILQTTNNVPQINEWLNSNQNFLVALLKTASDAPVFPCPPDYNELLQLKDWDRIDTELRRFLSERDNRDKRGTNVPNLRPE